MSRLSLKEHPLEINGRKFVLREMNGLRSDQIDDITDRSKALVGKKEKLDPEDLDGHRKLRAEIKACNYDTYRVLLIAVEPAEAPDDEWLSVNIGSGFMEEELAPIQTLLNAHKDIYDLGNSVAQTVAGAPENPVADLSAGPIFAAR